MIIRTCDKCGLNLYDDSEWFYSIENKCYRYNKEEGELDRIAFKEKSIDLCESCYKEFEDFLKCAPSDNGCTESSNRA